MTEVQSPLMVGSDANTESKFVNPTIFGHRRIANDKKVIAIIQTL